MKVSLIIVLCIIFLWGCKKTSPYSFSNQKGKFILGFGCSSWLIMREDSIILMPLNLDSFNIHPKGGLAVLFSYNLQPVGTTCMIGETIVLSSIQER